MCCCAPFVGHIPPMSLQNPKFPSKLNRTEMADEAELFCTSASKTVVFARLLVSVDDLHRGLSSFVFRMKQITQNPAVATSCGFDPRFRHQKSTDFAEVCRFYFFRSSLWRTYGFMQSTSALRYRYGKLNFSSLNFGKFH